MAVILKQISNFLCSSHSIKILDFLPLKALCKSRHIVSSRCSAFVNRGSVAPIEMAYSVFGDDIHSSSTPVVMLHGFLGSRTNWKSLAKVIATDGKCKVFTVDARNHGDSPHSTACDYTAMVDDLKHFLQRHKLEKSILIGHSMGGRTGMVLATTNPTLVEKLLIVDISPFSTPDYVSPTANSIFPVLRTLLSQLPPGTSLSKARRICFNLLPKNIPDIGLVDAILINLKEDEATGEISWRMNVNMDYQRILEPITLSGTFSGPTYFICGKRSPYFRQDELPTIRKYFPEAVLNYVEGAGHVVNFDKPAEFQKLVFKYLGVQ